MQPVKLRFRRTLAIIAQAADARLVSSRGRQHVVRQKNLEFDNRRLPWQAEAVDLSDMLHTSVLP